MNNRTPFQGLIHKRHSDPELDPTLFYFAIISFLQPMRRTAPPSNGTLESLQQDFPYQPISPLSGQLQQILQQRQNKLTVLCPTV